MAQLTAQIVSTTTNSSGRSRACSAPAACRRHRRRAPRRGTGPTRRRGHPRRRVVRHGRHRAAARGAAGVAIFAVAAAAEPDLILQAMRAGANEFFPWTRRGQRRAAMEESFHGAVRRTATRREAANAGAKPPCVTHVFLGAKGGAGTTTSR